MHLQSLELLGFKSFADRTVFNFHEGITAIVGPNGCGKSNVVDAVRWALGEQSAKSLRGDEMADVIFNGADTRKPVGFAEVSLTFTDCADELGIEWHEVRVTRRVYRDGNSEYLLNKTPCRLRDIQNLFADTGIARSAYSMMEQGKIDMVLSSRPEDRRTVFEEAAGITKYKAQKREALRKLEATEANLLRIGDVIKEVKRQIGSLQRQAGKARRYQALHTDLGVLETHYSRKQLDALEADLAECHHEMARLTESEQTVRANIEESEHGLSEERRALDKVDVEIADSRAEVQRLESEIATNRNRIQFNQQRAEELGELIERARRDIAGAESKRKHHAAEIEQTNNSIAEIERHLQKAEAELMELSNLTIQMQKHRVERGTRLQDLQLAVSKSETRISTLEEEFAGTSARGELTRDQLKQLTAQIRSSIKVRDELVSQIAVSLGMANHKPAVDVQTTLRDREKLLSEAEQKLAVLERTIADKQSRLDVLRQLNEEGEGLAEGSQAVLKGLDDPEKFRQHLAGSLVAQLDVDPKFIVPIEAALGRNLHAVLLKDANVVSQMIERLKKKKFGQAALLVPQLASSVLQPDRQDLPDGALAWASETVVASSPLESLVRRLLQNVVIFSDLQLALACKKREPALAMATLSGEFITTEGIIFGGSSEVRPASFLERKSQTATLEKEEASLAEERDSLSAKRDDAKTALEMASRLQRQLDDVERKLENLTSEKNALERQVGAADERVAHLERELQVLRKQLTEERSDLAAFESEQKQTSLREEELAEKITELRLAVVTERQRHENLIARREPMSTRDAELVELVAVRNADIKVYEGKLAAQAEESRESDVLIKNHTAARKEAERNAARIAEQRSTRLAAISTHEAELRELRDSLAELQDRRAQRQVRESQLQMKIGHLAEHVLRSYHVDLRAFVIDQPAFEKALRAQIKRSTDRSGGDLTNGEAAAPDTPARPEKPVVGDADLEKLIADLRTQLDNMGPVNLDAVHEYDELEERYKFLEAQNNDLTNSRRELLDVISQINSTTRKLFSETFAQVRINFRDIFTELFGGGRADLSLQDENDPLNCGIEITAKPPGKQLQSISLLSGGERSMVAVALLFAIYMVRPSPFCILDEVDAAMDEGNINRFVRVLERFVEQSQFIIITHNKRTIAKADILYGVTMEERGVSRLVGMKLTAPQQVSSEVRTNGGEEKPTQSRFVLAMR